MGDLNHKFIAPPAWDKSEIWLRNGYKAFLVLVTLLAVRIVSNVLIWTVAPEAHLLGF